jgi:hypothetical protein
VSATHPSKTAPRARRILCFAKSPSGFGINDIAAVVSTSVLALKLTDERLAAEIHQHRMMLMSNQRLKTSKLRSFGKVMLTDSLQPPANS